MSQKVSEECAEDAPCAGSHVAQEQRAAVTSEGPASAQAELQVVRLRPSRLSGCFPVTHCGLHSTAPVSCLLTLGHVIQDLKGVTVFIGSWL